MAQKSVLITGCSAGGIGSALVESFQKRNLQIFATARTVSKMAHLQKLPNVILLSLDVTSASSIAAALEIVKVKTGGSLDYLVNNSGISYVMPLLDSPLEEAKDVFEVNFWGVLAVSQAFAPLVVAGSGSIVNVSSISSYVNAPWMGVYGASKAALTMLSETLRLELAPLGVRVVTVITGVVQTNIMVNVPEVKLPSTSQYLSVEQNVVARARGVDVKNKMKKEDFAERVVRDLLGGATGKIWRGDLASTIHYLPISCLEGQIVKGTGLDTMTKQPPAGNSQSPAQVQDKEA